MFHGGGNFNKPQELMSKFMRPIETKISDARVVYYMCPANYMEDDELVSLHEKLKKMNKESGNNFNYGVFDKKALIKDIRFFFERSLVCIIEKASTGEGLGFFYNYLMFSVKLNKHVSHQGLVVIYNNPGRELITAPYSYANLLMWEYLKDSFYVSNISAVPLIIGRFSKLFDNVWPSVSSENLRFPPKDYSSVAQTMGEGYVDKYFPDSSVDIRRFVVVSPHGRMKFSTNLKELSRDEDLLTNLLTHSWIDLEKGEDMLQVGVVTNETVEKLKLLSKEMA